MSRERTGMLVALAAIGTLMLGGPATTVGAGPADGLETALLSIEDLPVDMSSVTGVTHEPQFDIDTASFEASAGVDKVAQVWQSLNLVRDNPLIYVFDFRFLFPSAEAAQEYLDAAEPILSESMTGITLQQGTPVVGDELRHYAGALTDGDVTLDVQNFLFRTGPMVAKVFVGGFGTTVDDALPLAQAASDRIDAWLAAGPIRSPAASPLGTPVASPDATPSAVPSTGPTTSPVSSPDASPSDGSPAPAGGGLRQWATDATASSQYGSDTWSALQATGAPDVAAYVDDTRAWAPANSEGNVEWLELRYAEAVVPTAINIVESLGSGAVIGVEAYDAATDTWTELWSGDDPSPDELVTFSPRLATVDFATDRIRITVDTDKILGWNEIDAVELVGTAP